MNTRCSSTAYLVFTCASTFMMYAESSTAVQLAAAAAGRAAQHAGVAAHGRHVLAPSRPDGHAAHALWLRVASGTTSTKPDCAGRRGTAGASVSLRAA